MTTSSGKEVKNKELILACNDLITKHDIQVYWKKGTLQIYLVVTNSATTMPTAWRNLGQFTAPLQCSMLETHGAMVSMYSSAGNVFERT